ncbi:MAG: peptidylprolyl isomerase [Flavobacteriales bacterium]|nr:peptidylprolyl isomerase [Flavobacteriales bacterium]
MKLFKTLLLIFFVSTAFSQNNEILRIDDQVVNKSEFEQIYWKNKKEKIATKEDLDEYIELFINFKLKVISAEELGLDTTKKFIDELSGYRNQLEKPYLTDTSITESLINEAYYRTINEINASHIMVKLGPNPNPSDTLKAYNKISSFLESINSGELSFEKIAEESSEDPYAKTNAGNLGYFNAFKMIYSFENAAYKTPIGDVSKPIRTRYGYHLVRPNSTRKAMGKVKTSHIMITTNQKLPNNNKITSEKINSIYNDLNNGILSFEELANKFSEDRKSAKNGGEIGWISSGGNVYPEFEKTVFSLTKNGDFSKPFKTPNGWHIVKRLDYEPIGDLKSLSYELKNKIEKDMRGQKTKSSFIKKLKVDYADLIEESITLNELKKILNNENFDFKNMPLNKEIKGINNVILSIENRSYLIYDFLEHLLNLKKLDKNLIINNTLIKLYEKFVNQKLIAFEKTQLEKKYPEFKALMKEYRDGILLFEISDQMIWTKAIKDTSGLKEFYISNTDTWKWPNRIKATIYTSESKKTISKAVSLKKKKGINNDSLIKIINKENILSLSYESKIIEDFSKYNSSFEELKKGFNKLINDNDKWTIIYVEEKLPMANKKLKECEGLVVSAYQNYLEKAWIENLKNNHSITVNYNSLYSIKYKP